MVRAGGQDGWNIQVQVNPSQVREVMVHPVVVNGGKVSSKYSHARDCFISYTVESGNKVTGYKVNPDLR